MKTEIEFTFVDSCNDEGPEFRRLEMAVDNNGQITIEIDGEEKQIVGKVWARVVPDRESTEREDTEVSSGDSSEGTRD